MLTKTPTINKSSFTRFNIVCLLVACDITITSSLIDESIYHGGRFDADSQMRRNVTSFQLHSNHGHQFQNMNSNSGDEATQTNYHHYFDLERSSSNVSALVGKTAFLVCVVRDTHFKYGEKEEKQSTVTWIRHKDVHILTVGEYTYTSDARFISKFNSKTKTWLLVIKYVKASDEGVYECQIPTTPNPTSHPVNLNVLVPEVKIEGSSSPSMFVNRGSKINLTCSILGTPQIPAFIFWYRNDEVIAYDTPPSQSIESVESDSPLQTSESHSYLLNPTSISGSFRRRSRSFFGESSNKKSSMAVDTSRGNVKVRTTTFQSLSPPQRTSEIMFNIVSNLLVTEVSSEDRNGGNYTCKPSIAEISASIKVHVLDHDGPNALQISKGSRSAKHAFHRHGLLLSSAIAWFLFISIHNKF